MIMLNTDYFELVENIENKRDTKNDRLIYVLIIIATVIAVFLILLNGAVGISDKSSLPDILTGSKTVTVTAEVTGTENVLFKGRRADIAYTYNDVEYTKHVSADKFGISRARKGDKFEIEIDALSPTSIRPSAKDDPKSLNDSVSELKNEVLYSSAVTILAVVLGVLIFLILKAKKDN